MIRWLRRLIWKEEPTDEVVAINKVSLLNLMDERLAYMLHEDGWQSHYVQGFEEAVDMVRQAKEIESEEEEK